MKSFSDFNSDGKKILVVVDMQKDFLTGPLGNAECAGVVDNIVRLIEAGGYDELCLTYDTHNEDYMNTNEGRHLPVAHCIKGTEGFELDDRIQEAVKKASTLLPVHTFEKPSFGSMVLAQHFMENRFNATGNGVGMQIDFCGVCTGICVISNVMLTKAAVPEADIRVLKDACACVTPESHRTALDAMKMCHIDIVG